MAKRVYHRRIFGENKKIRRIKKLAKFLVFCFSFLFFVFCFLFFYYAKDLPRPENFMEKQFIESTKIYDRTGEVLLYNIYGEEKRTIIALDAVPEQLIQAIITAEDRNFYKHHGIDYRGVMRAILVNLKLKKPAQGGSTITQQLIRSSFLTLSKTAERKIREIILTIELERKYTKDQIMEWYLNQVPFGSNAYGVEAASQTYFKKSVQDLSLEESAILASLVCGPSRLSPYGQNEDRLLGRKDYVLKGMAEEGYISKEEAEEAKKREISFAPKLVEIKAPHFTLYVKSQLEREYEREDDSNFLKENGLKVYTSLDWELQHLAETAVEDRAKINEGYQAHNASLVALNPKNGEVLAMVGSKNYFGESFPEGCNPEKDCLFTPKVNIAIYGIGRQPGSAFKPFVYVTAFQNGYDGETTVIDEETNFGLWGDKEYIPQNYDNKFRGEVTLREALAQSINVPSVKVLVNFCGSTVQESIENSVKTAQKLGITTLRPSYGPAIVLGGWEVRLLEMTSAYGVFATEGLKVPPVTILRIEDAQGNIIKENKKTPQRVLGIQETRLLNNILSDNEARAPLFGYNSSLYIKDFNTAAKTGTTEEYKDAWTIGYSPSIVCGVWAGNNDNSPTNKKPGVTLSAPIWKAFMSEALKKFPKENFTPPEFLEKQF
ncbi:MAG: PBP1A family penicillin-binding protein [Minisyncoccales bacterium]